MFTSAKNDCELDACDNVFFMYVGGENNIVVTVFFLTCATGREIDTPASPTVVFKIHCVTLQTFGEGKVIHCFLLPHHCAKIAMSQPSLTLRWFPKTLATHSELPVASNEPLIRPERRSFDTLLFHLLSFIWGALKRFSLGFIQEYSALTTCTVYMKNTLLTGCLMWNTV